MTFACFDSLGMGALLAFYQLNEKRYKINSSFIYFVFWLSFSLFFLFNFIKVSGIKYSIYATLSPFLTSIIFLYLIKCAARGFKGLTGKILQSSLIVYLGKISYGIYIYHLLTPQLLYRVFRRLGLPQPSSDNYKFWLFTVTTIICAIVSWHLLEKPLNLKSHFPYSNHSHISHSNLN